MEHSVALGSNLSASKSLEYVSKKRYIPRHGFKVFFLPIGIGNGPPEHHTSANAGTALLPIGSIDTQTVNLWQVCTFSQIQEVDFCRYHLFNKHEGKNTAS